MHKHLQYVQHLFRHEEHECVCVCVCGASNLSHARNNSLMSSLYKDIWKMSVCVSVCVCVCVCLSVQVVCTCVLFSCGHVYFLVSMLYGWVVIGRNVWDYDCAFACVHRFS